MKQHDTVNLTATSQDISYHHHSPVIDGVEIVSNNNTTTSNKKMNRYTNERTQALVEEGGYHALHHVASYHLVEKAVEINLILNEPEIDLWRLRELAISEGGLVNGKLFY
jgi:hypothetical protein